MWTLRVFLMLYLEKCCHLIFLQLPNSPRNHFFPIRNIEATWLALGEKCPGNPESSLFATVTKKKCQRTWISKHWRDTYYFWLLWKISFPSSLDTRRRKRISLLTMLRFSSTGLEHNVILCTVACTASELLRCCWEEGLRRFMHYKTSVRPHFTFNVIAQHKHRTAQIKLEI